MLDLKKLEEIHATHPETNQPFITYTYDDKTVAFLENEESRSLAVGKGHFDEETLADLLIFFGFSPYKPVHRFEEGQPLISLVQWKE